MNYMSVKEVAKKWGLGRRRVQYLCTSGKIPGATFFGKQWIIPAEAMRPLDGRTKYGKVRVEEVDEYHFPIFIFSSLFGTSEVEQLSDAERALYKAQCHFLTGDLLDGIKESRQLLDRGDISESVRVGALATIVNCTNMAGFPVEYSQAFAELEKTVKAATAHKDDYNLILAANIIFNTWNSSYFNTFDIKKLSEEALPYCHYTIMGAELIDYKYVRQQEMLHLEALCRRYESLPESPILLAMNVIIATLLMRLGETEKRDIYLKRGIKITADHNWLFLFAKLYTANTTVFDEYVERYAPEIKEKVSEYAASGVKNYRLVLQYISQANPFDNVPSHLFLVFKMVAEGRNTEEIAEITGRLLSEIEENIAELCNIFKLNGRDELYVYTRKLFDDLEKKL